ncbi:hypothetical protein KUTeg_022748 [Tegillarca granosa]|uniref:Uncharacterized protein n=1 Tax=Tegillarca granosa TaxID=220873 RepID=A0ABQ9DZM6_TEGGR|nr:hypothetical protein KUTeg_022748 [Tegillarca granosa]
MGISNSTSSQRKMSDFLIGNIKKKSDVEKKFFSLSYKFLDKRLAISNKETVSLQNEFSCCAEPNPAQQKNELDLTTNQNFVLNDSTANENGLFIPLKSTKKLYGTQTYIQWKASFDVESCFLKKNKTIYLVSINEYPSFIDDFTISFKSKNISFKELLTVFLEAFFCGKNVQWLPAVNILESKWNITSRYHKTTNKFQYLVTDFFVPLKKMKPKNGYCIMGMSWSDLYPCEDLNFVLGEASNRHKSGVFSFGRYEPKSFSESNHPEVTDIDTHVLWKLFKPLFLCPVCVRKLQHVCKFDIIQRYERLQTVIDSIQKAMPSQKWKESSDWLQRCLNFLVECKKSLPRIT